MPAEGVVVWRELGRWVFGIGVEGKPLFFQALAAPILGEAAGKEIRMSLMQLEIQGVLDHQQQHCFVWLEEDEIGPSEEQLAELGRAFGGTATTAPKPSPEYPKKPSALLPADTRAERVAKRKRQQVAAGVAALVIAYLGIVGWLGFGLMNKTKEAREAEEEASQYEGGASGVLEHTAKWAELEPVISVDHWPVELLFRCVEAVPEGGLRFTNARFTNQLEFKDGGSRTIRAIELEGEGMEIGNVNEFNLKLTRSQQLTAYKWTTPPAAQTSTGAWRFMYTASLKEGGTN